MYYVFYMAIADANSKSMSLLEMAFVAMATELLCTMLLYIWASCKDKKNIKKTEEHKKQVKKNNSVGLDKSIRVESQ